MTLILQLMRQWTINLMAGKRGLVALLLGMAGCLWVSGCRQPEAPEYYGFQNLQVSKIVGGQTNLSATVKLFNPNPYSLELKRAEVDIAINGKHAGHSLLDSTIFIPGKDTFYVPVALQVDVRSLFSNALQMILGKQDATVVMDGRVKIKRGMLTFNRPFHYEGKQDLSSLMPSGSGF
jgi:LEA14-like dessication related protein